MPGIVRLQDVLDNGEFIATQAGDRIALAHAFAQACRHLDQQLVAGQVAMRIVDGLEAVEIQAHQRHGAAGALGARQTVVHVPREQGAIGQAGQRIIMCQPSDLRLGLFLLGHVGDQGDNAVRYAVRRAQHRLAELHDAFGTGAIDNVALVEDHCVLAVQRAAVIGVEHGDDIGRKDVARRFPQNIDSIHAHQALAGAIEQNDLLVGSILHQHHGRNILDDGVEENLIALGFGRQGHQLLRQAFLALKTGAQILTDGRQHRCRSTYALISAAGCSDEAAHNLRWAFLQCQGRKVVQPRIYVDQQRPRFHHGADRLGAKQGPTVQRSHFQIKGMTLDKAAHLPVAINHAQDHQVGIGVKQVIDFGIGAVGRNRINCGNDIADTQRILHDRVLDSVGDTHAILARLVSPVTVRREPDFNF